MGSSVVALFDTSLSLDDFGNWEDGAVECVIVVVQAGLRGISIAAFITLARMSVETVVVGLLLVKLL